MTDKEKILAFLEGMSKGCCPKETKEIIINKIIPWINDLPKEPVSDNLQKAMYLDENGNPTPAKETEYTKGFLKGVNWQKEQLMAKAVDAVVKIDAGGYPYVDATIELYDYLQDIPLAKEGDKYKVALIKEE